MSEAVEVVSRTIIEHAGFYVDAGTGEVLGLVVEDREPFRVHDQDSAEWVMEKLFEAEAEVAAVAKRRAVLLANLEAMEKPAMRRVEWLRLRFEAELKSWANAELAGKKERTIRTPFGRLSFRKVKAQLVVDDEDKATVWALRQMPEAVKVTKKFLVSKVEGDVIPDGTHIIPARDSFRIETGASS